VTAHGEPVDPRPLRVVRDGGYPNWEAVYQDNATWVYRTIFARVGNRADAEDLTAEVFLAALRPLRLTASVGEVRAYLRTTARTVLAAHWRETLGREITSIDDDIERFAVLVKQGKPVRDGALITEFYRLIARATHNAVVVMLMFSPRSASILS